MAATDSYGDCFRELVTAANRWRDKHPAVTLNFRLPREVLVVGHLADFPAEWSRDEATRGFVRFLAEAVPEATVNMLILLVQRNAG